MSESIIKENGNMSETSNEAVFEMGEAEIIKNEDYNCKTELFISSTKIEINSQNNTVEESAYWSAPVVELHNGTHTIGNDLVITSPKVVFDHTNIQASHIYMLDTAEVTNIDSKFSCEIEYVTEDKLAEIFADYNTVA